MKLEVNGDAMEVTPGATVTRLLEELKLKPELVVVELNLNILRREQLGVTELKEGDHVEIVHFVGGGSAGSPFWPPAEPGRTAVRSKPLRGFSLSPSLAHPSLIARDSLPARSVEAGLPVPARGGQARVQPAGGGGECTGFSQAERPGVRTPSKSRGTDERGRERGRTPRWGGRAVLGNRPRPAGRRIGAGGTAGGGRADG